MDSVKERRFYLRVEYLWHGGMIDAGIENSHVDKLYIFINLRPVAVIEYENDDKNRLCHS